MSLFAFNFFPLFKEAGGALYVLTTTAMNPVETGAPPRTTYIYDVSLT